MGSQHQFWRAAAELGLLNFAGTALQVPHPVMACAQRFEPCLAHCTHAMGLQPSAPDPQLLAQTSL